MSTWPAHARDPASSRKIGLLLAKAGIGVAALGLLLAAIVVVIAFFSTGVVLSAGERTVVYGIWASSAISGVVAAILGLLSKGLTSQEGKADRLTNLAIHLGLGTLSAQFIVFFAALSSSQ